MPWMAYLKEAGLPNAGHHVIFPEYLCLVSVQPQVSCEQLQKVKERGMYRWHSFVVVIQIMIADAFLPIFFLLFKSNTTSIRKQLAHHQTSKIAIILCSSITMNCLNKEKKSWCKFKHKKIYRLESLVMSRNDWGRPILKSALAKNDLFCL